jgi:hypothetical protein
VKPLIYIGLLLVPSVAFLACFSDVPRFGNLHDDSIYYVSAKSLADGGGYRIESLPGEPAQTKYPPLYPLLLSIAWRINPEFPSNLGLAAWLSWLALPAVLFLMLKSLPGWGLSGARMWLVMALFAFNPYVVLFSTQLLSEMLFLALVLASMLWVDRSLEAKSSTAWAAAAGLAGGLAYLARSAGIVLLAAVVLYLVIRKQRRLAGVFAAAMSPFVIGWMVWARLHQTPTDDPALLYYVDYFRYQLYSVSLPDLHLFLWKNADGFLWGLGGLIVPKVVSSLFLKITSQVIAVAMISGVVRLVRSGRALLYVLFSVFSTVLLLVWHFPPNERFVLPLFPLALAGLIVELEHFIGLLRAGLRHSDRGQRVVAGGLIGIAGFLAIGAIGLQAYVGAVYLPEDTRHHRTARKARVAGYDWVRATSSQDAAAYSADDAVLYLYAGRHAMSRPLPPALWYREDRAAMVAWMTDVRPFALEHGLGLFEYSGVDIRQGIRDEDRKTIDVTIRADATLHPLFRNSAATWYRLHH